MMTLFTTAKPFTGPFRVIQTNALRSWLELGSDIEVIVFGDDAGSAGVCQELGIRHVPDVALSRWGTPLLSDMFRQADEMAANPTLCFINADIILTPDVRAAVATTRSRFERYLVVAQRRDVDIAEPLDFGPDWAEEIRRFVERTGELKSEIWIDWFAYPRGMPWEMPDLAVGRTGHDNWLIWRAGELGAAVVDATARATLIHQRHDFSHAGGRLAVFEGEEAQHQRTLIGSWRHYHTIFHAAWRLDVDGSLVPARGLRYTLARPKRLASHILRFSRPLRRRLQGEFGTLRRRRRPLVTASARQDG